MPEAFPDSEWVWLDVKTGERYIDPTNLIYYDAFRQVWPHTFAGYSKKTLGGVVEATLGLAWTLRDRGRWYPDIAKDFVEQLERFILAEYSIQTWYTI